MGKAADAFRTISEVADWLDVPAHVLRFWESKFTQIKPVKRAGGRRYYRPADMTLLGGIKVLLHDQGMTIKGAQKYLRENGIQQVSDMSPPLDDEALVEVSGIALDVAPAPARPAEVLNFARFGDAEDAEDAEETGEEETGEEETGVEEIGAEEEPDPQASLWSEDASPPAAPMEVRTPPPPPTVTPEFPPAEEALTTEAPDAEPASEPIAEPEAETAFAPEPQDTSPPAAEPEPEQAEDAQPTPDLSPDPVDDLAAAPGLLTAISTLPRPLSPELAARLAPLVAALRAHAATHAKDR